MKPCPCGEEATYLFWGQPRCTEHVERLKTCFNVWPPVPGSLAATAIEPIPAPVPPTVELSGDNFEFWKPKS
jgi:hypothetical protein